MRHKKETPKKAKKNLVRLILVSLMLSVLILYLLAACLWGLFGYNKALSFFSNLLKANQVIFANLDASNLFHNFLMGFIEKISSYLSNAHLFQKTQTLTNMGTQTLKEGLSGYLEKELVSNALETSADFLTSTYAFFLKAGRLFMLITQIVLIKACFLIAAIPLFFLLGMIGLIDGLVMREIRRAELGRESSYLFHMLNKWVVNIIGAGLFIWICAPLSISPQWFFVPLSLLFSVMLSMSASKFKKYV